MSIKTLKQKAKKPKSQKAKKPKSQKAKKPKSQNKIDSNFIIILLSKLI